MGNTLGAGYDAPGLANIDRGVTTQDVQKGQAGVNTSLDSQQRLLAALQGQNGLGEQTAALRAMQGTAGQYQDIASGRGPNPAQAMLNQQTGANVANQAALMAGQRGAGANAGLLARQAAQQGAATQQQAVGQGATMQANQSLNALSGLSGVQNNIAGLSNQMVANQMAGTQANTQANLSNANQLNSALGAQNQAAVSNQGGVNAANAGLLNTGMQGKQKILGGLMSGAGSVAGLAEGGEVTGPSSSYGRFIHGRSAMAEGGLASTGGHVAAQSPTQKAVKSGNSYANDKVPAMLSEGEIVIPRDVAMSADPIKASADFVSKVLAKRKGRK